MDWVRSFLETPDGKNNGAIFEYHGKPAVPLFYSTLDKNPLPAYYNFRGFVILPPILYSSALLLPP